MPGLSDFACDGILVISAVSMNRSAWMVGADKEGKGGLLQLIAHIDQRGQDRLLPTATGVIAYPRRRTVTEHELRLVIVGDVDRTGADVADHEAGLVTNIRYLMDNVIAPVASATGTRTATYTPPGGGTSITGPVHVTGIRQESYYLGQNALWEGTMKISIPAGALV